MNSIYDILTIHEVWEDKGKYWCKYSFESENNAIRSKTIKLQDFQVFSRHLGERVEVIGGIILWDLPQKAKLI